jgi:hypothetical protein
MPLCIACSGARRPLTLRCARVREGYATRPRDRGRTGARIAVARQGFISSGIALRHPTGRAIALNAVGIPHDVADPALVDTHPEKVNPLTFGVRRMSVRAGPAHP